MFFAQITERATNDTRVIDTALANPLDKFKLGIKKHLEEIMVQRMAENDRIVTRYVDDPEFQSTAFLLLAEDIFRSIHARAKAAEADASSTRE